MRRIVLIGNCQISAMASLYRRFVAVRTGDVLDYIPSYENLDEDARQRIRQADVVVEQLLDLKPKADLDGLIGGTPKVLIPMVTAAFLWPFAGQEHPRNDRRPFLPTGPYGGEAGDSYLNRLIQKGLSPEEGARDYMALDVGKRVNLDRLYELVMDRQQARDQAAGYRIADVIERYFRSEQIFLSPYHPNARVARSLAEQFFRQLGANRGDIERMRNGTVITPFPKEELPIHPVVARHFGLRWVGPRQRYRLLNEGRFTFEDFTLRYMRCEWNEALEEGIALSRAGDLPAAEAKLQAALVRSPAAGAGHNAMRYVLIQQQRRDEAIEAGRRAVAAEPDWAPYRTELATLLRDAGHLDEAEAEYRRAQAVDPVDPHIVIMLAHLLAKRERTDEAFALVLQGLELDPYATSLHRALVNLWDATGKTDQAIASMRRVLALAPDDLAMRQRLAKTLSGLGRLEEALEASRTPPAPQPAPEAAAQAVLEAAPEAPPEDAEVQELRISATAEPANPHRLYELSVLLERHGRLAEAVEAAGRAAELDANIPQRHAHLGHLASKLGELPAAESAFRRAIELAPAWAGFRTPLSDILIRQGRLEDGLVEAQAAVAVEPTSARAHGHLGHVLQLMGRIDAAEEEMRQAVELDPRDAELATQLDRLQHRRAALAQAR